MFEHRESITKEEDGSVFLKLTVNLNAVALQEKVDVNIVESIFDNTSAYGMVVREIRKHIDAINSRE